MVLNLIITGIPSIRQQLKDHTGVFLSFKPYYNWNTFNTKGYRYDGCQEFLSFKPYYNWNTFNTKNMYYTGKQLYCFKPYYNWNTFNTTSTTTNANATTTF